MPYWFLWIKVRFNNALYAVGLAKHRMGVGRIVNGAGAGDGGAGGATTT
jgi:tryptophan synthase beta subunit